MVFPAERLQGRCTFQWLLYVLFIPVQFSDHLAPIGVSIRAISIDQQSLDAFDYRTDCIHYRLVGRICIAFKTMDFIDLKFLSQYGSATHPADQTIGYF